MSLTYTSTGMFWFTKRTAPSPRATLRPPAWKLYDSPVPSVPIGGPQPTCGLPVGSNVPSGMTSRPLVQLTAHWLLGTTVPSLLEPLNSKSEPGRGQPPPLTRLVVREP